MELKEYVFSFEGNPSAAFHCLARSYAEAQLQLSDFLTRLTWSGRVRDGKWVCVAREVAHDASAVLDCR